MTPEAIKQIIAEKVEGVWKAEHSSTGHYYRHRDTSELVRSVTTKLIADKPHLLKWSIKKAVEWLEVNDRFARLQGPERNSMMIGAQEAYTEFRDDAGSVGSVAHEVAENYINAWIKKGVAPLDIRAGFTPAADPRSIASARAIETALKKNNVIPIATELLVGSLKIKTAGTLDFLCFWNGKLTLVDFKTSNAVSDDYACQVACYKYMFEEMTGIKIPELKILHLSKDYDKFTIYKVPGIAAAYKAYKGIACYYDWLNNGKEKVEKDIIKINLKTNYGLKNFRELSGATDTGTGNQG